jgi:hypothetical protein
MGCRFAASLVFLLLVWLPTARPQGVVGQISGMVVDPAGAVISGAEIRLTHDLSGQVRTYNTDSSGTFLFLNLVPGEYSVHIAFAGFKAYDRKAITVSALEKVALHEIKLEVGDVNSTVTVLAEVAHVATDSSDRDILVNERQIENTPLRGRDWLGVMQSLPGIVDLNNHDVPGWNSGMPTVNGGQTGQIQLTLDGVISQDSGSPVNNGYLGPSVDAIGEVKVLVSTYSAQYGSRGGGQFNVTIKNGTRHFHGSTYYFFRHEFMNANEYFNNQASVAKPLYRYQNGGGTIGGPLLIPFTHFNRSRTKLFFFFSEDFLRYLTPGSLNKFTMPTAQERAGDYSQTMTTTAKLIPIKDPTTAKTYPGNLIPASQLSPVGVAMLNLFPLPFTSDPTGQRQYNAIYQFARRDPREDRILRLDYNVASRTQVFARLMNDYQADRGVGATLNSTGGWGQLPTAYGIQSAGAVITMIHTFLPNLINELSFGLNRAHQSVSVMDDQRFAANQLSALKGPDGQPLVLPKIYGGDKNSLMYNLIPNIRFTNLTAQSAGQSITNPAVFTFDARFPFDGTDQAENVLDNVSWIKGPHVVKFGFYYERIARNVSVYSTYNTNGSYYFGSDTSSPYDTGYGYSNLLTGAVQAYGEDNQRSVHHARYNQFEWYAQDSWRVGRRLSLDFGVRFQYPGAVSAAGATLGFFDLKAYDPAKAGKLLFPAVVNGQNAAVSSIDGTVYLQARSGFFDPASYPAGGSPYSGMVQYKKQAWQNPGLVLGPRVGFASDLFGNGKVALRGGFGIFYDRAFGIDTNGATGVGVGPLAAPPAFQAPVYYNTTFPLLRTAQSFIGPQQVFSGTSYKHPSTYNWSFGIQRDLGKGMMIDVAYVGNIVHHKFAQIDRNGVAPYTMWTPTGGANPKYLDPTTKGTAFLNANLIRPIAGYSSILTTSSCGEANYNSLQTQFNKRFGRRLQFGANWTWSKTMTYTRNPWTSDYITYAEVGGSRPQVVNINYSYNLPNGSRIWRNKVTQTLLDGWHFNGITKFMSGNPLTVTCSAASAPIGYWTGTTTGGIPFRCDMRTNDPFLPAATPRPATAPHGRYYPLNAANFKLPVATSLGIGNIPPTWFYGPGFENFDFTLLKDIRLKEGRAVEIRIQTFNAFNHFNPGNPNTALTLNYTSGANTNANFGTITAAVGQARHVALAAKFRF